MPSVASQCLSGGFFNLSFSYNLEFVEKVSESVNNLSCRQWSQCQGLWNSHLCRHTRPMEFSTYMSSDLKERAHLCGFERSCAKASVSCQVAVCHAGYMDLLMWQQVEKPLELFTAP